MDKVLRGEDVREALKNGAVLYRDHGGGRRTYYWLNARMFPVPKPRIYEMVLSRTLEENDPEYDDLDEVGEELDYFINVYGSHGYLIYKPGYREIEPEKEEVKMDKEYWTAEEAAEQMEDGEFVREINDKIYAYYKRAVNDPSGGDFDIVARYYVSEGTLKPLMVWTVSDWLILMKNMKFKPVQDNVLTPQEAYDALERGDILCDKRTGNLYFWTQVDDVVNQMIIDMVFTFDENRDLKQAGFLSDFDPSTNADSTSCEFVIYNKE